jgi:predicted DNA-binding transcriptional regulator YafY
MRDLQGLHEAGLPIFDERDGREKRWQFVDGFRSRVPPPFTVTELLSLYFARRLSRALGNTPFYASLESAYAKIASLVPPEAIALVEGYDDVLGARPGPFKDYSRLRKLIEAVTEHALGKKSLDIRYHTFSRGATTERRVDPYRVFYFQGGLYVIAFDHLRGDIRIFALERIREWTPTSVRFDVEEGFDFERFMKCALGVYRGKEIEARIRFQPSAAPFVAERQWHESQELSTERDGSIVLTLRVADTIELRRWILSFGASAEVLDPPALRDEIRGEAQRMVEGSQASDLIPPGQLFLPIADFLEELVLAGSRD